MRKSGRVSVGLVALAVLAGAALLASCSRGSHKRPPDIVIVVLDTVRSDRTALGGERSVTPTLDRLGEESTVFTRAWANGPWTVPSHASIFSGLLPSYHRCTSRRIPFLPGSPTFAELLSARGYETVAFYSNPWLSDRLTGMLIGFEERFDESGNSDEILKAVDQGGGRTLANVSRWLDGRRDDRPLLMFVNFLEAHLPYDPPSDYRETFLRDIPREYVVTTDWAHEFNARVRSADAAERARVARLYDGDVNTSDRCLAELIKKLDEHGLYENAVIIVTSDHGENLGEHGFLDHQFGVFETLIDVPLVVRAPGRLAAGHRDDPVMLTDIYDTVLELAGVEDGPQTPHSRSLLSTPADRRRPQIAEYDGANRKLLEHLKDLNPSLDLSRYATAYAKVRVDSLELVLGSDGSVELHDLVKDPGRKRNIAASDPGAVGALRVLLPAQTWGEPIDTEIDAETREQLESLGYIQ
jgi:arylsulfatase A-like enzyme